MRVYVDRRHIPCITMFALWFPKRDLSEIRWNRYEILSQTYSKCEVVNALPPSANHQPLLSITIHITFPFWNNSFHFPSPFLSITLTHKKKSVIQASGSDHYTHHHNTNYSKHLKRFIIFYYYNCYVSLMCMKIWYTANFSWKMGKEIPNHFVELDAMGCNDGLMGIFERWNFLWYQMSNEISIRKIEERRINCKMMNHFWLYIFWVVWAKWFIKMWTRFIYTDLWYST